MSEAPASPSNPRHVARMLAEIGVLLELNGRDAFRARAFANAARALEVVDADLLALARTDGLTTLRGVGEGIAAVIREYLRTGRSTVYEELRTGTPPGLYDLLRVPGLGPKRIHTLHAQLGIDGLDALEQAATMGRIAKLPGFGGRTEEKILEGIGFARSSRQRQRYPEALEIAVQLLERVRGMPGVSGVEIAGALRRRMEVVDEIALVAAAADPTSVLAAFWRLDGPADPRSAAGEDERLQRVVTEAGASGLPPAGDDTATLLLRDRVTARLRCVPPDRFVAAMLWETGSTAHLEALAALAVERGAQLDAGGLTISGQRVRLNREADAYQKLGLAYVAPELREGQSEVERAATGEAPVLVELSDLRGTFHCHTTYSDGKASMGDMVAGARQRGWSYLGLADHSPSAVYANGLSVERVRTQGAEVDRLNRELDREGAGFRIFRGIESDILPDGSLDYPDDVLRGFDYVVGSIHSSFGMTGEEMTRRVIRAVRHPSLTIIGHLTGRLLLTREGYQLDVPAVLRAAAEADVVVEINANPHRLDLDWRHVRTAAELGILIAVNPDAHSVAALDHVAFGVNMARKAGLEPRQVLNTWPLEEVAAYFGERKQAS